MLGAKHVSNPGSKSIKVYSISRMIDLSGTKLKMTSFNHESAVNVVGWAESDKGALSSGVGSGVFCSSLRLQRWDPTKDKPQQQAQATTWRLEAPGLSWGQQWNIRRKPSLSSEQLRQGTLQNCRVFTLFI